MVYRVRCLFIVVFECLSGIRSVSYHLWAHLSHRLFRSRRKTGCKVTTFSVIYQIFPPFFVRMVENNFLALGLHCVGWLVRGIGLPQVMLGVTEAWYDVDAFCRFLAR